MAWYLGYVYWTAGEIAGFLLATGLGHCLFPWLIHSSRNLNFSDPSLTSLQIGWHLAIGSYAMYAAPEIRSLLVINLLLIMLFSVFRFQPNRLPLLSMILFAAYSLSVMAQVLFSPLEVHWSREILTGLVFFLAVIGTSLLGAEIGGLRLALKKRNEHLAQAMQRIEELAVTDELTGLYNRRHLMRILRRQKGLSDRGGYHFSIGFVDLDFFKQINDNYGHGVGDQVLVEVAAEIRNSLREVDYVARIGGEEFVVVLSQTAEQEALRIAERLRADIEKLVVDVGDDHPSLRLTASVGIASYQPEEGVEQLMVRADRALYAAKECGRNCIIGETDLQGSSFRQVKATKEFAISENEEPYDQVSVS
ncbi:GGDEF domain-containing protein [Marinospirillum perlucidum]|uniref:GGDEF domain-containing protein n=1 Tax=Marinospirillum perlucidum TaxID=1982602 RepID=UPI0013905DA7|nr:GGDEF domain-containing protein [Marinospirillum perlucidum]